jgi:predicted GTPase
MTIEPAGGAHDLSRPELEGMFETKLAEAFASLGCFNLAVFGKTGAGKSTLVNAIFGRDVAVTGVGRPVTKGLVYYRHPDGFLGVYDSEGFETGTAGNVILDGLRRLVAEQRDPGQGIHAIWYCVRWSDRRLSSPSTSTG